MTTDLIGVRCAFRFVGDSAMTGEGWVRAMYPNPDGVHICNVVIGVDTSKYPDTERGSLVEVRIDFVRVIR